MYTLTIDKLTLVGKEYDSRTYINKSFNLSLR